MIVAVPPGGPADTLARMVGPRLSEALGQPVVIDNRPGANGNIAYEMAARAAPDGYTFVLVAAGVAINPSLYRQVRFDPVKDFAPITEGIAVPNILIVHPAVPANSVKELIALAKARPGKLAFASAGSGSSGHLALEAFKHVAAIDVIHVPYKGGGPALTDVIAGQVQALFSLALVAVPQVKAGKVRALAITSLKRNSALPDVPTLDEIGLKGYEVTSWFGLVTRAGTPRESVMRLNTALNNASRNPKLREILESRGADVVQGTPEDFLAFVKNETAKFAPVIQRTGVQVE